MITTIYRVVFLRADECASMNRTSFAGNMRAEGFTGVFPFVGSNSGLCIKNA